ncbi:MAG: endo-1,4-beta-xylanase [Saprospiraceae bacterium]
MNFATSQDEYHSFLQNYLQAEYNLPTGEWLFSDNENTNINAATHYGASVTTLNAQGQDFNRKEVINVNQGVNDPWAAGWSLRNGTSLAAGEMVLTTFYLRSLNGSGEVNFFLEDAGDFSKEAYLSIRVTEEWQRYFIPIQLVRSYSMNSLVCGFHLALQAQELELGGFTTINFGNTVAFQDLPNESGNQFYGGYELDAPWRATAAERIAQLRKADLTIQTTNTAGENVTDVPVKVQMLEHEFSFGTAIKGNLIAGNSDYNIIYENKLTNLDGNGHGFNTVVFENDLKWPAWEDEWFVNKSELSNALSWITDNNLRARGHTLVWPGAENLPNDINQNIDDIDYIKNRVNEHIENILTYPKMQEVLQDWDVLNEVVTKTTRANRFQQETDYETGRELYVEIFNQARNIAPEAGLFINDYITLSVNNTAGDLQYDQLKQFIGELVAAGAPIDGIGFQGHIGGAPNDITSVLTTLDDFYDAYGLRAKITEFDLPSFVNEELGAQYMRDFMTAIFSHPSIDAFLFWNFWDGATWQNGGTNLYRQDWSETPAHATFVDLLFNEWWTNTELVSDASGTARENVFKGRYEISYQCGGQIIRDTIQVNEAMNYTIQCDELASPTVEILNNNLEIFPNPATDLLILKLPQFATGTATIFNQQAQMIHTQEVEQPSNNIRILLPKESGVYYLEWKDGSANLTKKFIVK